MGTDQTPPSSLSDPHFFSKGIIIVHQRARTQQVRKTREQLRPKAVEFLY